MVLASQSEVKPSYASVLQRGTTSVPPAKGYAASATALSSIPPHPLAPTMKGRPPPKRKTLDANKLYLDSAATHHSMFCKRYLTNIRQAGKILRRNCNAGAISSTPKGDLGMFEMWVNESRIANLLSIPQLEKDGFRVVTDTLGEWVVYTPQGEKIVFMKDTSLCNKMLYLHRCVSVQRRFCSCTH